MFQIDSTGAKERLSNTWLWDSWIRTEKEQASAAAPGHRRTQLGVGYRRGPEGKRTGSLRKGALESLSALGGQGLLGHEMLQKRQNT